MTAVEHSAELAKAGANITTRWQGAMFLARHYPLGAAGAIILIIFVLTAIFAGSLSPFDPTLTNSGASLARPGAAHWLGADFMGRDVFSRIVGGSQISLAVGLGSIVVGCRVGVPIGLLSGYFGGWVDLTIQRLIDMMQSLPLLVTALVMAAALGPSLRNTIIAIAIPLVPSIARIVRSNTLALKEMPFVEAARAIGLSETWIAIRHVLPNTLAPLIVLVTAQFGSAILVEASLSFLGLGVPEPFPSWGACRRDRRRDNWAR